MNERTAETEVTDVVERLSGIGCDARHHPALGVITFFDDEFFENYDYDILGPGVRDAVHRVAEVLGWRRRGSREFVSPSGGRRLVFPRPQGVLGASPLDRVRSLVGDDRVPLLTPTQAMLLALHRNAPRAALTNQLEAIASVHPANLPKVAEWSGELGGAATFRTSRARLEELQKETIDRRRNRR